MRISRKAARSMDSDVDDDDDLPLLLLLAVFSVGVCGGGAAAAVCAGPGEEGPEAGHDVPEAMAGMGRLKVDPARPVAAALTPKLWPGW